MIRIKKLLYSITAFLTLTNLFVMLSAAPGLSLTLIGAGMIIGMVYFLFLERVTLVRVLSTVEAKWVIGLVLVWPFLHFILSFVNGYVLKRELILQVFYVILALSTMVYVLRYGFYSFRKITLLAFWTSAFGVLLNVYSPSIFYQLSLLNADSWGDVVAYGRAGGFFLNPNNAARFMILMFIFVVMAPKKFGLFKFGILSSALLVCVLLTGSRSSMLICGMVISLVIILRFAVSRQGEGLHLNLPKFVLSLLSLQVISIFAIIGVVKGTEFILDNTQAGARIGSASRYDMFSNGFDEFVNIFIEEGRGRLETTEPYLGKFKGSFYIGNGMAGARIFKAVNQIELLPHNTFFLIAFDYSVFYLILTLIGLLFYCLGSRIRIAEFNTGILFSPIFIAVFIAVGFTYDALFNNRAIYVIIGALLCIRAFPETIASYGARPAKSNMHAR